MLALSLSRENRSNLVFCCPFVAEVSSPSIIYVIDKRANEKQSLANLLNANKQSKF